MQSLSSNNNSLVQTSFRNKNAACFSFDGVFSCRVVGHPLCPCRYSRIPGMIRQPIVLDVCRSSSMKSEGCPCLESLDRRILPASSSVASCSCSSYCSCSCCGPLLASELRCLVRERTGSLAKETVGDCLQHPQDKANSTVTAQNN